MIVACDPGAKGAIAYQYGGLVEVHSMPETDRDIYDLLTPFHDTVAYIERVGGYMPGNSGPAAVKFARHCGVLDGILACLNVRVVRVSPAKWMRAVCPTLPKDKGERKRALKRIAQDEFPNIKVTLVNADALCLLKYAMEQERNKA